jgi:hypothetical protein
VGFRFQTSTAAIMLLVAVVALELVMFQGVWRFVVAPPNTMLFLAFNLGLFFMLVRPRSLETWILGMIWGGVAASFGMVAYGLTVDPALGPAGVLARVAKPILETWANSLSTQRTGLAGILRFLVTHVIWFESVLLDLLGITVIAAGGSLENSLRGRLARARAPGRPGVPPLDDRAATPV